MTLKVGQHFLLPEMKYRELGPTDELGNTSVLSTKEKLIRVKAFTDLLRETMSQIWEFEDQIPFFRDRLMIFSIFFQTCCGPCRGHLP